MIRIDPSDSVFSQYIRLRDGQCMRCHSPVKLNNKGLPISHHNSHYFGRGRENTRFDPENCDTLCHGCHRFWETGDREAYRSFKISQLGEQNFNFLTLRANTYAKRDRKMALLSARILLNTLLKNQT